MRLDLFVLTGLLLLAPGAARAELWKYEDGSGAVNFTDDISNVPPEFRHTARRHVVQDPPPAEAPDVAEIKRQRLLVIESFSPEQAKEALAKGLLTVDEVNVLVKRGALRTTDAGDQYRFAGKAAPKPAAKAQPVDLAERDLQSLMAITKERGARAAAARSTLDAVADIKNSPKFTYALVGEGVLAALLIVTMPFVMRRYNDDGTRRIIRASFFLIFLIVSATGNLVLFKDEIATLLSLKNGVPPGGAAGDAATGEAPASLQGRPWQPDADAGAKP